MTAAAQVAQARDIAAAVEAENDQLLDVVRRAWHVLTELADRVNDGGVFDISRLTGDLERFTRPDYEPPSSGLPGRVEALEAALQVALGWARGELSGTGTARREDLARCHAVLHGEAGGAVVG